MMINFILKKIYSCRVIFVEALIYNFIFLFRPIQLTRRNISCVTLHISINNVL